MKERKVNKNSGGTGMSNTTSIFRKKGFGKDTSQPKDKEMNCTPCCVQQPFMHYEGRMKGGKTRDYLQIFRIED